MSDDDQGMIVEEWSTEWGLRLPGGDVARIGDADIENREMWAVFMRRWAASLDIDTVIVSRRVKVSRSPWTRAL